MAFSGKAMYDAGVFGVETAEDVSPLVTMISPFETRLLDVLGDAPYPAFNIYHEWSEDALAPNSIVTSSAIASASNAAVVVGIAAGDANYLQQGTVLLSEGSGEYLIVEAIAGNSITLTRNVGANSLCSSYNAGATFVVISDAAQEGADVSGDISRARPRKGNYCQIYKKDVIISGTVQAVRKVGGITSELDYQIQQRSREALRDLEKSVIRGIGNVTTVASMGGASNNWGGRTMQGLWKTLRTNAQSVATLTESWLGNIIKAAWDRGARDLDLIVADANYKRVIDSWNATRIRTTPDDSTYRNLISEYESTFGMQQVVLSRWMPPNAAMILSSQRVKVLPLQGRSFAYVPIAPTGDSAKGMVIGEYTLETKNEDGLAKIFNG